MSQGNRRVAWIYNARTTKKPEILSKGWGRLVRVPVNTNHRAIGRGQEKRVGTVQRSRPPAETAAISLLFLTVRSGCHPGPASPLVPGVLPYWPWRAGICAKCIFFLRRAFVTLRTTYDTVCLNVLQHQIHRHQPLTFRGRSWSSVIFRVASPRYS
jgi:hypothetical protein